MGILDDELNFDFDIDLEKEPKKIDDTAQKQTIINTLDFSFDIPEDKIEIQKKKQASIGISSILAESERLSFDEFFRNFDKKELPALINGELTLFTNNIEDLVKNIFQGKQPSPDEWSLISEKVSPYNTLSKRDLHIIKLPEEQFKDEIVNYKINNLKDLDNFKTILRARQEIQPFFNEMINRSDKFLHLLNEIKSAIDSLEIY